MAVNKIAFQTKPNKYCSFSLYGERQVYAKIIGPEENFDIEELDGTLIWQAEITSSPDGIHAIDFSGKMESISFVISVWQDDDEDKKVPITVDTSSYEVTFDFSNRDASPGSLVPYSIDIDISKKTITVD